MLLINLIAFVTLTKAQSDLDSFKIKHERFKNYLISDNSIGNKWINPIIGFNDQCDTIYFQDKHYDLSGFNSAFDRFITDRFKQDTIVLRLDYRENISLNKIQFSYEILANQIEKYSDKGIYYFSTFHAPKKTIFKKADTMDLHHNKVIEYNGKPLKYSDLSNHLQVFKPDLLVINADSDLPIQDLTDILDMTKKLMIKTILGQK